ncbi:MAG: agmatinase [Gemmatimonadaceae bacterium]
MIGVPYDASSSFRRGAAAAPPVIRKALASPSSNSWTESFVDLGSSALLEDAGDLELPATADARRLIEVAFARLVDEGRRPIALGGDHSVTYPILRALRHFHPSLTVVQFDAHPDLYAEFEGDRYSHACPFARIMEEKLADHLVQVGTRTMTGHQRVQAERFGVEVIDIRTWSTGKRPRVRGPLYVSIDIDALDPAFAPGVSHREPGGLSVRDIIGEIQALHGELIGADVVEFNPSEDVMGLTAPVCAKLVKELAGRMLECRT